MDRARSQLKKIFIGNIKCNQHGQYAKPFDYQATIIQKMALYLARVYNAAKKQKLLI
jgi:hypothetical protein